MATIGPSSSDPSTLVRLIAAGVDVVRLNLSHGDIGEHLSRLGAVRAAAAEVGRAVAVLADLPGPKIRAGRFPEGGVELPAGSYVRIVTGDQMSDAGTIAIDHPGITDDLVPGDRIVLGDGAISLTVDSRSAEGVVARVDTGGRTQGSPGVHLSSERLGLTTPTAEDLDFAEVMAAAGVEYLADGASVSVGADREVIVCAGTYASPQLLMLSGIGNPEHLKSHGIETRVALSGVGQNLQDHISSHVYFSRREPGTFHKAMRLDRIVKELGNCYFRGKGLATELPGGEMAFLKSDTSEPLPDIQFLFNAAPMTAYPYFPGVKKAYDDGFSCRAAVLRPTSRGEVTLKSADPGEHVRIKQNFLQTERDKKAQRAGLRMVRDVMSQKSMQAFISKELQPGPDNWSDAALDEHVKVTGITVHHPACTCKMGQASDPMAVVDPELKVIGARNLRVVDASVMPDLVGGNINAPVIMIAEKAADMIAGKPALAPATVESVG